MKKTLTYFKNTRLHKNEQGVTAIEFAFVAPVLFTLIFGMIEFGIIMFMKSSLDNAMNTASRLGITGSNYEGTFYASNPAIQEALDDSNNNGGQGITREFIIRQTAQRLSGGIITGQKIEIGCTSLGSSNSLGTTKTQYDSCNLGGPGEVIVYNARYNWEMITPFADEFMPADFNGKFPITSTIVVKNEDVAPINN